ncbi:SEFIR domain-containing protein [Actinocrispum wychmicini]|uniref:NPCBM/NEW2 domain-containing protein n=1 Tax=Actinocrispum wychmicini TaxID=1213861 RepID=A0A4R2J923_9PSEU|nr:SEFIR domain-containing protein [Actinocrispum wychmicini]TCO55823.1 NPCBM/NEW2 domain-containing protein [Actinocrispum wychmicini]
MSDGAAPRVFISYAHDTPEHVERVRVFATFLRHDVGLDVRMDQWDDHVRRDWSIWAATHLTEADFVLVIVSPQYKNSGDGMAPPHVGRGSHYETAIIRNHLTRNLRCGIERVLPVILPGYSLDDVPEFLTPYSTTRFRVKEFTEDGIAGLLAAITGRAEHPMPERGEWRGGAPGEGGTRAPNDPRTRSVRAMPWLAQSVHIRGDTALIDGVRYDDSIVLRPSSSTRDDVGFVEVDLAGAYRRMKSVVGVVDDAIETFQVGHFRVFVDGHPRYEGKAAVGKPATVEVDLTGSLKLRLEMCRPGVSHEARLPELAWGNPTLC